MQDKERVPEISQSFPVDKTIMVNVAYVQYLFKGSTSHAPIVQNYLSSVNQYIIPWGILKVKIADIDLL